MRHNFTNININGKSIHCTGNSIVINNGKVVVDGVTIESGVGDNITIEINGDVENLNCVGCVEVHGNAGSIECGGSCKIGGNVNGNIDANGSVICENVTGNIDANGSVVCKR